MDIDDRTEDKAKQTVYQGKARIIRVPRAGLEPAKKCTSGTS